MSVHYALRARRVLEKADDRVVVLTFLNSNRNDTLQQQYCSK